MLVREQELCFLVEDANPEDFSVTTTCIQIIRVVEVFLDRPDRICVEIMGAMDFTLPPFKLSPFRLTLMVRAPQPLHHRAHPDVPKQHLSVHTSRVNHALISRHRNGFHNTRMSTLKQYRFV